MPKLKYKARRDIPNAVRQLHTFSPKEIRAWILSRFNKAVTTQSISMWLTRNPDVKKQLEMAKGMNMPLDKTFEWALELGFLPGVTDNVANTATEIINDLFKINLGRNKVYSLD